MSMVSETDIAEWRGSIGRTATQVQRLDATTLRRFALAINADPDVTRLQPALAHWAYFLDAAPDAELGDDGHPKRGGFLPAIALPRRMFAATAIQFHAPLQLDAEAEMTLRIADVQHKSGRTGDLVFVEVERTIGQQGVARIEERQSLVYRGAGDGAPLPLPEPRIEGMKGELWHPRTVNLFRFSAVTFNGHRIHYDHPYATQVEGYPALVVHGPFAAARLAELAARRGPLASFAFRAQAPLFVDQPIGLRTVGDDQVEAVRCDGVVSTVAKVTYR